MLAVAGAAGGCLGRTPLGAPADGSQGDVSADPRPREPGQRADAAAADLPRKPDTVDAADAKPIDKNDGAPSDAKPPPPPPPPPPSGKRLTDARATLVGTGANSCTPDGGGDVWCAFAKPSSTLGKYELWALDVTAVASASKMADCMTGDGQCRKLSADFYLDDDGIRLSSFAGRTLVFYADAVSAVGSRFAGKVWAWRPEFTKPQQLSSASGYRCFATRSGGWAYCYDALDTSMMGEIRFDWLAGEVKDGGPVLARQDSIVCCEAVGVARYSARFSPDEKWFVWSGHHAIAETEVFRYKSVDDLAAGTVTDGKVFLADGSTALAFAADGKRVLFLGNVGPTPPASGDLYVHDWPPSGVATMLHDHVTAPAALADLAGGDRGVMYFRNWADKVGELWMAPSSADVAKSRRLVTGEACQIEIAPSFDRVIFSRNCDPKTGLADRWALAVDPATYAPAAECGLAAAATSSRFARRTMTDDGRWSFWVDDVDISVGTGAGRLTDLATCKTVRWGSSVWSWTPVGSKGFVENDDSDGIDATLRVVDISTGAPSSAPAPGTCPWPSCLQKDAGVTFAVRGPPSTFVVYTLDKSSSTVDGLWYRAGPF